MAIEKINPYEAPQSRELSRGFQLIPGQPSRILFYYEAVVITLVFILTISKTARLSELQAWLAIGGCGTLLLAPLLMTFFSTHRKLLWTIKRTIFIYTSFAVTFLTFMGGYLR